MARILITESLTDRDGVVATYDTPDITAGIPNGASITNTRQQVLLHVKNTDAAIHIIHVYTQSTRDGKAVKDRLISMPATTGDKFIGPFGNNDYGVSGVVYFDVYDASGPTFDADDVVSAGTKDTTGVTVAAIALGVL